MAWIQIHHEVVRRLAVLSLSLALALIPAFALGVIRPEYGSKKAEVTGPKFVTPDERVAFEATKFPKKVVNKGVGVRVVPLEPPNCAGDRNLISIPTKPRWARDVQESGNATIKFTMPREYQWTIDCADNPNPPAEPYVDGQPVHFDIDANCGGSDNCVHQILRARVRVPTR